VAVPDAYYGKGSQYLGLKTLGDTALEGLGVLAAAPWIPGASDILTARASSSGTVVATLITPTSGRRIRIVAVLMYMTSNTGSVLEVYFGTGATIGTSPTKSIYNAYIQSSVDPNPRPIWPDGGGPVGLVDEVVSTRGSVSIGDNGGLIVQYREE
jgi:hypothetical protein